MTKSYPCGDGGEGRGGAGTVDKWNCTAKDTKALCAQDVTTILWGVPETWGHGKIGVRELEAHPRPKFTTDVFLGGAKMFLKRKKNVALDRFINNS